MSATAKRSTTITYSGDVGGTQELDAADNTDSPAQVQIVTLAIGANTITVPGGGTTPTCCTIVKPSDNTTSITLKGVTGDTGIRLHDTDPDSISIDDSVTTFVLTAAAEIIGVRLYWS
jgi:hypothetical protein